MIANLNIKSTDCHFIISRNSKSEAITLMENINFTVKNGTL